MPYSFRRASLQRAARLVDLALVGFALVIAMIVSSGAMTWPSLEALLLVRVKLVNLFQLAGYLVLCSLVFSIHGFYRSHRATRFIGRFATTVVAVTVIAGLLMLVRESMDLSFAENEFLLNFWFICSCTLLVVHEVSRTLQYVARLHGKTFRNVVIVGDGQRGTTLASRIEQQSTLGYRVLRIITTKQPEV